VFVGGDSISEKLKMVQQALQPDVSVVEVARVHGVNTNQVFAWRRAFERGEPIVALISVKVSNLEGERREPEAIAPSARGSIHIEFPSRAVISVESGADSSLFARF
jgi:transposase-like protein